MTRPPRGAGGDGGPPPRRQFVSLLVSTAALLACGRRALPAVPTDNRLTLYIGTYTRSGASRGIYHTTLDPETLAFGALTLAAPCEEPSYLARSPDGRTLVAVNERLSFEGAAAGSVTAFARTAGASVLVAAGPARSSRGAAPCHVTVDATGAFVLLANYVGGNVSVHPLGRDGIVGDAVQTVAHAGTGPHATRQTAPHAHCIVLDAGNRFAVAADLGADRLFVYRFDAGTGRLAPTPQPFTALAPGAGPRHVAFAPDGRTLYSANELDSTLSVFDWNGDAGTLTLKQTVSTRAVAATGENFPAALRVHPDGRTVYLSNRGDNSIAVFAVHPSDRTVSLTQTIASGGDWPRDFTLTPDGKGLLVAHQRSNTVVAFRIDAATGHLASTGRVLTAPMPVSLLFV